MASTIDSAKRTINGTYGSMWFDGRKIAEIKGFQLKSRKNSTTINLAGEILEDTKMTSVTNSGQITIFHVDSGFADEMAQTQRGADLRHTLRVKLADPDSFGAETINVFNVSLSELTAADWQAATVGEVTTPFTCGRYEFDDRIPVQ